MSKQLIIDSTVIKRLRSFPKEKRVECLLALCELIETFGRPHIHTGLGIRKLGGKLFECRGPIDLRFVFQDRPEGLFICFLGNHDEVKQLLRSGKYS